MDQMNFLQSLEPGVEGVALVDKPAKISSHGVVSVVRRVTGQKRVGHAGTLDPLATGLLIILIGKQWTKKQDQFMKLDKSYLVQMQLGYTSETYDTESELVSQAGQAVVQALTDDEIMKVLDSFIGTNDQVVPAYSAVKVKGKKLYELARKGKQLAVDSLPSRKVTMYSIANVLINRDKENEGVYVSFEVRCSSGTYIRSLVHDIGKKLGVGAVMTKLQRTSIGPYKLQNALSIKKYLN